MSYRGRMIGRKIDYSSMTKLPNIDTMCSVLSMTQSEQGIAPYMEEASYDRNGKKINRFKRNLDGRVFDTREQKYLDKDAPKDMPVVTSQGMSLDNTTKPIRIVGDQKKGGDVNDDERGCTQCKKEKKKLTLMEMGFSGFYNKTFGIYDSDDDDDDFYVCDFCTDLGYSGKYKPYLCDNCTKCETCSDFSNGSCDGCSYSKTRTGSLYSEQLSRDQIIDSDDIALLEELELEDNSKRKSTGKFSTLNY